MWVGNRVRVRVATTPLTFDHPGQWLLAAWARRDRHGRRVASTPLALCRVWEPPPIPRFRGPRLIRHTVLYFVLNNQKSQIYSPDYHPCSGRHCTVFAPLSPPRRTDMSPARGALTCALLVSTVAHVVGNPHSKVILTAAKALRPGSCSLLCCVP